MQVDFPRLDPNREMKDGGKVEAVGGALLAQAGSHAGVTLSPKVYSPPSTEPRILD